MSNEIQSNVNMWLSLASKTNGKMLSLFPSDYATLNKLTYILPTRTIRDKQDRITLVQVDKQELIKRLKSMFNFMTKEEITSELKEISNGPDSNS